MKPAFALFHREHINRRDALKLGAATAAAAAGAVTVGSKAANAQGSDEETSGGSGGSNGNGSGAGPRYQQGGPGPKSGTYSDEMFDVEAVLAGAWDVGPYGPGDQRGSLNEVTPWVTAAASSLIYSGKAYQLGEEMFNGFPAFPSDPPRLHDMFLYVLGYQAPGGFEAGGGIQSSTTPIGPNLVSAHEERFSENFTFQIATQVDGLNHIGLGEIYYNGFRGPAIATPTGTTALGNETMGPIATRGVIYDVVGLKVDQGATDSYFWAQNGEPVLVDNYRITLDDMRACLQRQGVRQVRSGEVPILHTGWTHLARTDPNRYLTQEPGIYLEEARYFADKRVALVATDTWGLEVLDPAVTGGNAFPVHQELIVANGIRIGESFVTDAAIADGVYEGMLIITPENVPGATCSSAPPTLIA